MLETLQKIGPTDEVKMDDTWRQSAGNDEVAWLAGFIDGEGSVGVNRRQNKKGYQLIPQIQIYNTHKPTIERVASILSDIGVGHRVAVNKRRNPRTKLDYVVQIAGMKRVRKLLNTLDGLLFTKAERAKVLRKFVEHRLSVPYHQPYGDVDAAFYEELRTLNKFGASTSIRQACENTVKMCSGLHGDMQRTAEMPVPAAA